MPSVITDRTATAIGLRIFAVAPGASSTVPEICVGAAPAVAWLGEAEVDMRAPNGWRFATSMDAGHRVATACATHEHALSRTAFTVLLGLDSTPCVVLAEVPRRRC